MQPPAIKTIALSKKFGNVTALENLSLEVPQGEIFAFLGPNGAGKTTTIKLLTGLLIPTGGSAQVAGFDIRRQPLEAKKNIGLVADQPYVYEYLTGFEYLRFVGDIYAVSGTDQKKRIPELLALFELSDWADDLVESYSHGMKQKLVFAGVLLHQPKVLILDEPLVGLDPKSARLVKNIFFDLAQKGTAIFMSTHVLEIAEKLAHRVGIIQKGRLIALESVEGLKEKVSNKGTLEDTFLELTGDSEPAETTRNV